MRKQALLKREIGICRRLRAARERLGWTQQRCASAIGIDRGSLTNHEYLKSPVRYEVALRFCRNLIVSEEWLATGKHAALEAIAQEKYQALTSSDWSSLDPIFFRQSVDLLADPAVHTIRPGSLFSRAYDDVLAPRYATLAGEFFYTPRIVLTDRVEREIALTWTDAVIERWLLLLENEARRLGKDAWLVQRNFARSLFLTGTFLYSEFLARDLDLAAFQQLVTTIGEIKWVRREGDYSLIGSRRLREPDQPRLSSRPLSRKIK